MNDSKVSATESETKQPQLGQDADTTPEDTAPADTTPEDIAPVDTAPADTAPEDTAPEDIAPADTAPADTAPEDTAPEDIAPADTAPADTAPADTAPADTAPADTAPEDTADTAEDTAPADTAPEDTAPEESVLVRPSLLGGDPDKQWYVLRTRSGFERKVNNAILTRLKLKGKEMEDLVEDIFVPGEDVVRIKDGKKRKYHVIYFTGYVLIKMNFTNELWHLLMDIPYVNGFVGGSNEQPRALSKKELLDISSLMDEGIRQEVVKDEYDVGQQVMIVDGPFTSFVGEIASVNTEKSRLRVLINILGRATPVEIDFSKVRLHTGEE